MLTRKSYTPLVTLAQMKAHLRIDPDEIEEDDLIGALIDAASAYIDGPRGVLGRCVAVQEWTLTLPEFSAPRRLPLPFLSLATAVSLLDDTPVPLRLVPCGIWSEAAPVAGDAGAVRIEMSAAAPDDLWPAVSAAIKLLVAHWYLNREAVVTGTTATNLPLAVDRLLTPLKVSWV